jgi:starch phosphorylase
VQIVYSGKAHPRDLAGKSLVGGCSTRASAPGKVVFLENYDMRLGALLTRGADVWLNNPRRPLEASGTSGMKAAMNGVPNLSILDGWWPEGCEHGVTAGRSAIRIRRRSVRREGRARVDRRDRELLHRTLEREVLPAYVSRPRWTAIMRASIEMSQWRFSSDRMVEEYVNRVYRGT